jgi:uncharacterized protein YndB with AHSA1/START domain
MRILPRIALLLSGLTLVCGSAAAQTSNNGAVTVTRTASPEKRLDFEVTVPAPVGDVWQALTTSEGTSTWLWRDTEVDLRVGGNWLVKYPGGSTGGGTILEIVPQQRLAIAAMAPEEFPTVRRERTRAVFELRAADSAQATVVHLTQTGWKSGGEWDKAYDYLADGDAELLNNLRQRFVSGPFDWDAIMKQMEPEQSAASAKRQ